MRDPAGRNKAHARDLLHLAERNPVDLRVVELDVQSKASADRAVETIRHDTGRLDVVVHKPACQLALLIAFHAWQVTRVHGCLLEGSPLTCSRSRCGFSDVETAAGERCCEWRYVCGFADAGAPDHDLVRAGRLAGSRVSSLGRVAEPQGSPRRPEIAIGCQEPAPGVTIHGLVLSRLAPFLPVPVPALIAEGLLAWTA
jgi:hypothetical protein